MDLKEKTGYTLMKIRGRLSNAVSLKYLKDNYHRRNNDDHIRVGFIVHETETWDKSKPIYEEMQKDDLFQTMIIVCPCADGPDKERNYGHEWEFFSSHYPDAVKAVQADSTVIDLRSMHFDYLFYQDPYIVHYPASIGPEKTNRYAKLCYIPYGLNLLQQFSDSMPLNRRFYGSLTFAFLDAEYDAKLLTSTYADSCAKGYRHFITSGYPALAEFMQYPSEYPADHAVWTPRWAFDSSLAKSHFLDYKDQMLTVPETYHCKLVFRPHPLMYATLIKNGLMTKEELDDYNKKLEEAGITVDLHSPISDIFHDTGILISDFSSIIIQFFMTGRPVIYCSCGLEMNETFKTLIPGIYVADSWEDIDRHLKDIRSGNDYLAPVRQKIIQSEQFKRHIGSASSIVKVLKDDWSESVLKD